MDVKIGNGPIRRPQSMSCNTDRFATLDLQGDMNKMNRDLAGFMTPAASASDPVAATVGPMLRGLRGGQAEAMEASEARVAEMAGANEMIVRFSLDNGETTDIVIPLAGLKSFAQGCVEPSRDTAKTADSRVPPRDAEAAQPGPTYTVDQFAAILPGLLNKAAVAHGVGAHGYDAEIKYITDVVRTCAEISPKMARDPADPTHDRPISGRYGLQYQICEGKDAYRHMYLRGVLAEDISMASGHYNVSPYASRPFRADVGLGIYQMARHQWNEGKGFYLTLAIVNDKESEEYHDTLLSRVHIERSPTIASDLVDAKDDAAKGDYATAIDEYKHVLEADSGNAAAKEGIAAASTAMARQQEVNQSYLRDGEWVDTRSGLMWTVRDSERGVNWRGAIEYCGTLRAGGFSKWRLPTIEELRGARAAKGGFQLRSPYDTIWSSSQGQAEFGPVRSATGPTVLGRVDNGGPGAWALRFDNDSPGNIFPVEQVGSDHALCVRPYDSTKDDAAIAARPGGGVEPEGSRKMEASAPVAGSDAVARGAAMLVRSRDAMAGSPGAGTAALMAIKDAETAGFMRLDRSFGGATIVQKSQWMSPMQCRTESTSPNLRQITYWNGTNGWRSTLRSFVPMVAGKPDADSFNMWIPLFLSDLNRDRTVRDVGNDSVEISDQSGNRVVVRFDPASGLPVGRTFDIAMGRVVEGFEDWQQTTGEVRVPRKVTISVGGRHYGDLTITSLSFNPGLRADQLARRP